MDANVRAAAAETLRLCREAGHDVSPAVAALYVQAQRLAKVHPNDLVAHCVAKLAAAGDPALETLKMQMDVEATRALRAHAGAPEFVGRRERERHGVCDDHAREWRARRRRTSADARGWPRRGRRSSIVDRF